MSKLGKKEHVDVNKHLGLDDVLCNLLNVRYLAEVF